VTGKSKVGHPQSAETVPKRYCFCNGAELPADIEADNLLGCKTGTPSARDWDIHYVKYLTPRSKGSEETGN